MLYVQLAYFFLTRTIIRCKIKSTVAGKFETIHLSKFYLQTKVRNLLVILPNLLYW